MSGWPADEVAWLDGVDARSVFRALEVPWEGATSREIFAEVMGRLEAQERGGQERQARRLGARGTTGLADGIFEDAKETHR